MNNASEIGQQLYYVPSSTSERIYDSAQLRRPNLQLSRMYAYNTDWPTLSDTTQKPPEDFRKKIICL